jgi:hypothetical protein
MSILPEHNSQKEAEDWEKLDRDEFAELRSHDASKISYDFQKTTAQACLLINGGAATAVVALLAKEKVEPAISRAVPWCLSLYAIGVAVSAFMMFCSMMRSERWNYFWYHFSYTADEARAREHEAKAIRWERIVQIAFVASIACFLLASFGLAIALVGTK